MRISTLGTAAAAILVLVLGACGGGGGGGDTTTTQPAPVLASLSPSSATAGTSGITVNLTGSNFTAQSVVQVSSSQRTTTFVSASQLSVQLTAADLASAGQLSVSVSQPNAPASNTLSFTVNAVPPSLSAYSPTQVEAGGGNFMLTVLGKAFTASSVVRWNGASRPTTFVSATEVIAQIPGSDIANVGSATVDVSNGASGATSAVTVQIEAPSKDAVSLQINTAHTGAVTFQSITFPSTSTWSVDVGGPPSVALIAGGKVFVTAAIPAVSGGAPTSTLLALDAATGTTVWSATGAPSVFSLAYDSGKLIVMFQAPGPSAVVGMLDADTGNALAPRAELVSNLKFLSAPVARDGLIFVAAPGNFSGTDSNWLYAISEQSGAVVWQQSIDPDMATSVPVVTVDGVYLSYANLVYAFRPLTGESIWSATSAPPLASAGATGVVANGSFFAPDAANTYNGHVYSAATGALQGTYTADGPPAIGTQAGYFLSGGTLNALSLNGFTSLWSFTGDGHLVTSPLLVGNYVIVGSDTGNLYALDATSGTQAWQVNVGAPLPKAVGYAAVTPYSGMSAGDGLLVVPSGNSVVAYTLSTNP